MSNSKFTLTKENTYLARVAQMILGPCTNVLRDILRKEISPADLETNVRAYIANRTIPRINKDQEALVYGKDYTKFDVTLLYFLLRNICSIKPHSNTWGNVPSPGDKSVSANIERIRLIKNYDYSHYSETSISDTDFNKQYKDILDIVQELENYIGSSTKYQDEVKKLEKCPMDPAQCEENIKDLLDLREKIKDISEDVEKMKNTAIPTHTKDLIEKDISRWKKDDAVYLETHNFHLMMQQVRQENYVTFVGVPGSGKTVTARHIALKLQEEGYEIVPTKNIHNIESYCGLHEPQVFVIDDVIGVLELDKNEFNKIQRYRDRFREPPMAKTKIIMTCRELVFRNELVSNFFLSKSENVVLLHSDMYTLTDEDKQGLLAKYNVEVNILSLNDLSETSKMFPLLCKIFSKFKGYGPEFFISPIPCILEELDNMKTQNRIQYAALVVLMVNQSSLSKQDLGYKHTSQTNFYDIKCNLFEACKVDRNTGSSQIIEALSEMEGTYTQKCDRQFTFIHDSMFQIIACHFGRMFPKLILEVMSSVYIANYVKIGKHSLENTSESIKDICIILKEDDDHCQMFAERLLKDTENRMFGTVFGNDTLKYPLVVKAFIEKIAKKPYEILYSLFFSELVIIIKKGRIDWNNIDTETILSDYRETNILGIHWVIFFGHHQILEYIIDTIIAEKGDVKDLFNKYQSSENVGEEEQNRFTKCLGNKRNSDYVHDAQYHLLCLACHSGDLNTVKVLLNHVKKDAYTKILPNKISEKLSRAPLLIACNLGYSNIAMELVERGADINACDGFSTPLINVCIQENAMFARKLIRLGADVNQKGNRTPLTATCSNGNLEVFNELIKEGADVNLPDNECYPLEAACIGGNLDIVSKIIALGVDVNVKYKKQTPLALACKNGHFSIVEELIKARADVNLKDLKETPLTAACDSKHPMIELERMIDQFRGLCRDIKCTADYYSGHLSVIEKLSRSDVNIYLTDEDKTDSSCCSTYQNIVLALVKAGADVNLSDGTKTPLTAACRNGRLGIVEELIRAGADVNQSDGNNTPLTSVCCCEPLFVEKSIKKWRDVNLSNDDKVIIEAKRNEERLRIIKDLLKAGANVNLGGGPRTGDVSLETTVNHEKADGFIKVWKDWGSAAELDIEKEDDSLRYKRQTPLTAACDWGVLRVVEELINAGANVNLQYQDETPLTRACYQGKVNVVEKLIDSGANLNQRGGDESPLFIACKEGHLMVVKMLLKAGSYVDPREIGKTPLIAACDSKHILAADELYKLQNNARQIIVTSEYFCEHLTVAEELFETPVSLQHVDTNAPLSASCCSTYQNIVLALIEAGAIVNLSDGTKTPLTAACRNGRLGIVEELIRAGADVNQSDGTKTPLTAVCCSDPLLDKNNLITGQHIFFDDRYKTWINNVRSKVRKEIVLELLKARADVNLGENDAPTVDKKRRDLTLVEKLTNDELGVNIQYKGQTPLIAACDSGYRSVVKELIEAGAKVNWKYKNETPLTLACYRNHVSVVDELLKSGADINLSNGKKTPLIIACEEGHLETINQLMDARADVNLRENEQTPLIAACDSKHLSAVDEMFNNRSTYYVRRLRASTLGISMKAKCFQNIPLKAEYFSEHLTVVEKLRVLGFRVNVNHGDEQSPLFSCCMRQQKIVLALMKAGADVNFSDGTKTPLTAACRNGRLGIVEELIRAGADVNQSDGNKTPLTTCFCSDPLSAEESYKNWSDDNLNDDDKLLLAARRSNVRLEIVKKLLKAGAETN